MQGTISFDGTLSGGISGGGGGGSEVTITPVLTEGTKIADYSIDSESGSLYAPTPEGLTAQEPLEISNNTISIDLSDYATDAELENAVNNINSELNNYTTNEELESAVNNINSVLLTKQNKIDFSTEEQNTGRKWVDGKSIYQKTYLNVNLSNSQDIVLDTNVSTMQLLSYVIDFCGIPNTLTKHIENASDTLYIDNRGLIYYINRTTSWWNELNKANITVYYTKN